MDAAGIAIAIWNRMDLADRRVEAALRPPGGSFAGLGTISPAGGSAEEPTLEVTDGGVATVVWRLAGSSESFLQATTRPPGGGSRRRRTSAAAKTAPSSQKPPPMRPVTRS